ncbi:NYN domain-containing protein [Blastopirellula marina]|uniref:YacP-like NYN domain protein n=1 Tax=Blastopirellula marina TaxID=124 RepID=A0A2S8F6F7_9BACT|nr:NYN domain-containing protein [Blastopirellula marina]PQO27742.1 hypothetical protein C5Y98_26980 [Blastopirellula marina]PTL41481.1 hypothetical protein C5Y97_26995 [Blastopirellula marina]
MSLIIDGYNLLFAAGLVGSVDGEGSFEGERRALLDALLSVIDPKELPQTTVVFDSAKAPPGLPRTVNHQQITVRFATGYADADEMIEELIRDHHAPKRLTVVSSDHRVQRAARRRKAKAIDSDSWFRLMRQTRKRMRDQEAKKPPPPKQPSASVPNAQVNEWIKFFGEIDLDDLIPPDSPAPQTQQPQSVSPSPPSATDDRAEQPGEPKKSSGEGEGKQSPSRVFSEDYLKKIAEEFFGPSD